MNKTIPFLRPSWSAGIQLSFILKYSTSIYDLVLLDVCHFHYQVTFRPQLEVYWDHRAYILDLEISCIHSIPYIFPFSMLYNFECTGENFSLRKAVLEIKEDLKSEAIWYIFGPFTKYGKHGPKGSFEAFYRTHFFVWICGNCRNSLSHFFRKNFVKLMVLVIKLLNSYSYSWFDEIYFQWTRNSLPSKLFSRQINL